MADQCKLLYSMGLSPLSVMEAWHPFNSLPPRLMVVKAGPLKYTQEVTAVETTTHLYYESPKMRRGSFIF